MVVKAGLGGVSVTDTAGVSAGAGCAPNMFDPSQIDCAGETPDLVVVLSDGSDQLNINLDGVRIHRAGHRQDAGTGDDRLILSEARETVSAGEGNDNIEARSGDDQLAGSPGRRRHQRRERLRTRSTAERQRPPRGRLLRLLGPGNDTINSRDGEADTVSCWLGTDVVTADQLDVIGDGMCESVDIASGGGGLELGLYRQGEEHDREARLARRVPVQAGRLGTLRRARRASGWRRARPRKRGLGRRAVILGSDTAAIPEGAERVHHDAPDQEKSARRSGSSLCCAPRWCSPAHRRAGWR